MERDIIHVNVTAFPVGVERAVDTELRDRPVVIAVPYSPRAVTLAVSREAYLEGVMKGMPVGVARKICRGLTIIPPNEPLYRRASNAVFNFVSQYSPLVEPWRAGHFYVDLTGTRRLFGATVDVSARIQKEIKERFSLRNTVGLASNKLVSRVASRVVRPRGLCDVFPGGEAVFLAPQDVDILPGIGPKTAVSLADLNIFLVGELAVIHPEHLFMAFGALGYRLHRYARGIDESPVRPPEKTQIILEEETLAEDSNDDSVILGVLYLLVERAGRRLRKIAHLAGALKLEIIYSDHVTMRREGHLSEPGDLDGHIFSEARRLLEKAWTRRIRLRHLSLTLKNLMPPAAADPQQLSLFDNENNSTGNRNKEGALVSALDAIRGKYGEKALRHGSTFN